MSKTAIKWGKIIVYGLIISAAFLVQKRPIFAAQYQQCSANSNCSIGEFLYDDNYQPISVGSSCTLTSRYPNGDILINGENMTGSADGWYSYSVGTSGLANGLYRGQMCCTTDGETICLDKTFEVAATLSNLVADIWASPNRSLTDFGNLVSNIWNHSIRQLTSSNLSDGTSLATSGNINSIGSSLTTLSTQISAVQTEVISISSKVDDLQTKVNTIETNTDNLLSKWGSYSQADVINYIDTLETQLGNNTQTCANNSVFGNIQCIKDKWGSETASTIYTAANNAYITASNLRSEIGFNGKSTTAYDEAIALKAYVDTIESSIGATTDTSSTASLFGRIKQVNEAIANIDNSTLDLNDLLAKWDDLSASDIYDKVSAISTQVSALNTVTNVENITNNNITQNTDLTDIKNQILAMRALLDTNRILLEKLDNQPVIKSWLENGSIIFKSLITNPSKSISQDVPFVYYLPPEVKESDIIKKSDNLTIKYDTSKGVLYATGDFKLKPKETLIVEVEVKDIWSVPQEKIESLRRQANELFVPLKKTSYFAQGATLNADIIASLDRIVEIQKPSKLPEEKIKDYRDAQIELDSVNKKMDSLKEIVTSAGSIGTLSGFIGGVQTMGVWGIIVVLVAGFGFLAFYIKKISSKKGLKSKTVTEETPVSEVCRPDRKSKKSYGKLILILMVFSMSSIASGVGLNKLLTKQKSQEVFKPAVLSAQTSVAPTQTPAEEEIVAEEEIASEEITPEPIITVVPTITATPTKTPIIASTSTTKNTKAVITPSINSYVNVRSAPDRDSALIFKILSGSEITVTAEKYNDLGEKWVKIVSGEIQGWVLGELIQYVQNFTTSTTSTNVVPSAKVMIDVPPHDVVYIYSKPSFNASITNKINEDQNADILLETKMWAKVILSRLNIEGWVSQDFIQRNIQ